MQYEILKLLAAPDNNLFVVGDDDQFIYRFLRASPKILLDFPVDYPLAKTILLDQNFRCSRDIIVGASHVIENNTTRYRKKILPVRPLIAPIEIRGFPDESHESLCLLRKIQEQMEKGLPLFGIAILMRMNAQAGSLIESLSKFNIPFRVGTSFPCVFDHWIAEDIFAFLRLAQEGLRREDFLQVMNRSERNLPISFVEGGTVFFP